MRYINAIASVDITLLVEKALSSRHELILWPLILHDISWFSLPTAHVFSYVNLEPGFHHMQKSKCIFDRNSKHLKRYLLVLWMVISSAISKTLHLHPGSKGKNDRKPISSLRAPSLQINYHIQPTNIHQISNKTACHFCLYDTNIKG